MEVLNGHRLPRSHSFMTSQIMEHFLLLHQTLKLPLKLDIHGMRVRHGPSSRFQLSPSGLKTLFLPTNQLPKTSFFTVLMIRAQRTRKMLKMVIKKRRIQYQREEEIS